MVRMALSYVHEWKKANSQNAAGAHGSVIPMQTAKWCPPPPGYYKIKIDVAMDFDHHLMGYGWIVRDSEGVVKGTALSTIEGIYSVKEAEAIGAREALSWIKKNGWSRIVLETDAKVVTSAVIVGQNYTPFGAIIDEIREHLEHLPLVRFVFVKRAANVPAHTLAKYALSFSGEGVLEYFDFIPHFVSSSVSVDFSGLHD
ncbi:PREDICTED: uncharacterized protein LOC109180227 [Ipomoea nil]|uniref:uncharacterized protein LOC109180227 n=1 Tax=Ipomoea nil TaxID=35883 RepID=UPI000901C122|nr:PREDICTED: uncharacterized protein LOC109180227 [Ipomoea nil]